MVFNAFVNAVVWEGGQQEPLLHVGRCLIGNCKSRRGSLDNSDSVSVKPVGVCSVLTVIMLQGNFEYPVRLLMGQQLGAATDGQKPC